MCLVLPCRVMCGSEAPCRITRALGLDVSHTDVTYMTSVDIVLPFLKMSICIFFVSLL